RTSKAAARLAEQFREGTVEKVYWAVVEGEVGRTAGSLEDWLSKDRDAGRVEVVEPHSPGARQALLHYQCRAVHGGRSWVEARPQTGRRHQLRVQLAHHGHRVYGDAKYGSVHTFPEGRDHPPDAEGPASERRRHGGIALHARSLTFLHPVRYEPIT